MISGLDELELDEATIVGSICRSSFYRFVCEFFESFLCEPFIDNWHIPYLCGVLQTAAERVFLRKVKKGDIVVNIPPGTTKSTICSVMFPPWVWTRMPQAQFITASYTDSVGLDLALKSRDLIWSEKYRACYPEIILRQDQHVKSYFKNTLGGSRYTVGVGGQVQGMHGHFLMVDDPIDPERSASEADLRTVNRWMTRTLPTRKVATYKRIAPIILIMQRLHQDDPTQTLLDMGGDSVQHICLPGEITDDVKPVELRKHYKDGLLDPVKMPRAYLEELWKQLGEYGYAGQVLQRPIPEGGMMFKTGKIVLMQLPGNIQWVKIVRYWDKAGTAGGGAKTAGVKMGKDTDGKYWVLDVTKGQWGVDERERRIREMAEMDGKGVKIRVEQEPGSGGKDSALWTVRNLAGFSVSVDKVGQSTGNKEVRAEPYASQVNIGNVCIVPGEWNKEYLDELRHFPNSKYKDQVDASSGAFNDLSKPTIRAGGGWHTSKGITHTVELKFHPQKKG
jgi:predicted phage terminase large subunit-like protein